MFILYLHKVRSDREVVAETKFLRLAEINQVHAEEIKQSIYENF